MENSNDSDNPSMSDVENCLKEAGSYDVTMTQKEMLEIYQVLRYSRNTATEEDEQRRILQQTEANCSMIEELRRNSVSVNKENDFDNSEEYLLGSSDDDLINKSNNNNHRKNENKKEKPFTPKTWQQNKQMKMLDIEQELPSTLIPVKSSEHNKSEKLKSEKMDFIDIFGSIPNKHIPLKQITISPRYDPPFYCNKEVVDKDIKERAQMIFSYHLTLHRIYNSYQRQSTCYAPWGKTIQPSNRFNGSLSKKIEKFQELTESAEDNSNLIQECLQEIKNDRNSDDDFETYTSKSGRQTKRKLYTENMEEEDNDWYKKSKSVTEIKDDDNEWYMKNKPSNSQNSDIKKPPPKKRRGIGALSNDEIMKRSKLFTDTNSPVSSRSEKIFEKLVEDDRKKKEVEREIARFDESLAHLSGEENEENVEQESQLDIADVVHIEEPFTRRRIVPPSHAKKPSGRGKTAGRGRGAKKITNSKLFQENTAQEPSSPKYQPLETSSAKKTTNSRKRDRCPICNEEFLQTELMEHASTCTDSYSEKSARQQNMSNNSLAHHRITCETCDQVLPLDSDYEVHVHECIIRQMRRDNNSS